VKILIVKAKGLCIKIKINGKRFLPDWVAPLSLNPCSFPGGSRQNFKGASKTDKERKIGHRRVNEEGEVSYKKIQTNQLMASIQLGIQYSISR